MWQPAELWHRGSVVLGRDSVVLECGSVVSEGWDGNWWIPCIIHPPDQPETKGTQPTLIKMRIHRVDEIENYPDGVCENCDIV